MAVDQQQLEQELRVVRFGQDVVEMQHTEGFQLELKCFHIDQLLGSWLQLVGPYPISIDFLVVHTNVHLVFSIFLIVFVLLRFCFRRSRDFPQLV